MWPAATLIVTFALIFKHAASDLPPNLPRCYVDDPKINSCLLNATIVLKPYVRRGIAEIGIPSYDPFIIPFFEAKQDTSMANYTVTVWNYIVRGLDNYDITEIGYDPKTMTLAGKIELDPVYITSAYQLNGKVLFLPVRGAGSLRKIIGPIKGTFKISGKMLKRKSIDYYDPVDVNVKLEIDDLSVNANGLYSGDLKLGLTTLDIINGNSQLFMKALTPLYDGLSEKLIMRYTKWLTRKYPYHELLPRSKSK